MLPLKGSSLSWKISTSCNISTPFWTTFIHLPTFKDSDSDCSVEAAWEHAEWRIGTSYFEVEMWPRSLQAAFLGSQTAKACRVSSTLTNKKITITPCLRACSVIFSLLDQFHSNPIYSECSSSGSIYLCFRTVWRQSTCVPSLCKSPPGATRSNLSTLSRTGLCICATATTAPPR